MLYWITYFKLEKYITGDGTMAWRDNKTFAASISTNGIDVSILMQRRKLKKSEGEAEKKKPRETYRKVLGLDPGLVQFVGGIRLDTETNVETNILVRGKSFNNAGTKRWRRRKRERRYRAQTVVPEGYSSKVGYDPDLFARTSLEYLQRDRVFTWTRTRTKWDAKICRKRALDRLADSLIGDDPSTLICMGDGEIRAGIRYGCAKLPKKELEAALKRNRNCRRLIKVDEFKTTKFCAKCWTETRTSRSLHRY